MPAPGRRRAGVSRHQRAAGGGAIRQERVANIESIPGQPLYLHTDLAWLTQVLANLLNKTAEYSNRGGRIVLTVRREGGQVLLAMQNHGTGIHADHRLPPFERFPQVAPVLACSPGGFDLEAALVRGLGRCTAAPSRRMRRLRSGERVYRLAAAAGDTCRRAVRPPTETTSCRSVRQGDVG